MSEFSEFITNRTKRFMDELSAIRVPKKPAAKPISPVRTIVPDKTKGELPDGTIVDVVPVGTPDTSEIGYRIKNGTYMIQRDPLKLQSTDGGDPFNLFVVGPTNASGDHNHYVFDVKNNVYAPLPLPSRFISYADKLRYEARFSYPTGRHIVFFWQEKIVNPTTKLTTSVSYHWRFYKNWSLSLVEGTEDEYELIYEEEDGDTTITGLLPAADSPTVPAWSDTFNINSISAGSVNVTLENDDDATSEHDVEFSFWDFDPSDGSQDTSDLEHPMEGYCYEYEDSFGVIQPAIDFIGKMTNFKEKSLYKRILRTEGIGADGHSLVMDFTYSALNSSDYYGHIRTNGGGIPASESRFFGTSATIANPADPVFGSTPGFIDYDYDTGSPAGGTLSMWTPATLMHLDDDPDIVDPDELYPDECARHQHSELLTLYGGVSRGHETDILNNFGTFIDPEQAISWTWDKYTGNFQACTIAPATVPFQASQRMYRKYSEGKISVFRYSSRTDAIVSIKSADIDAGTGEEDRDIHGLFVNGTDDTSASWETIPFGLSGEDRIISPILSDTEIGNVEEFEEDGQFPSYSNRFVFSQYLDPEHPMFNFNMPCVQDSLKMYTVDEISEGNPEMDYIKVIKWIWDLDASAVRRKSTKKFLYPTKFSEIHSLYSQNAFFGEHRQSTVIK